MNQFVHSETQNLKDYKISIGTTMKYKGQANPGGAKFFQCPIGPYFLIPAIVKAKNVIVANAKFKLILAVT